MLIAFAFSLIGILIIFGNYKLLRDPWMLAVFFVLTLLVAALGAYLVTAGDTKNPYFFMAMFSPLTALIFMQLVRAWYKKMRKGQELILYLGNLLPKSYEERFVSSLEKAITFLMTVVSLAIPYLAVMLLELAG